jgi:hypothetical protein
VRHHWRRACTSSDSQPASFSKKGLRGRFGMYVPPLLEALGLAELTHDARGNKMRAL